MNIQNSLQVSEVGHLGIPGKPGENVEFPGTPIKSKPMAIKSEDKWQFGYFLFQNIILFRPKHFFMPTKIFVTLLKIS